MAEDPDRGRRWLLLLTVVAGLAMFLNGLSGHAALNEMAEAFPDNPEYWPGSMLRHAMVAAVGAGMAILALIRLAKLSLREPPETTEASTR